MTEIKKINMISNDEKFRKDLHITEITEFNLTFRIFQYIYLDLDLVM